MENHLCVLPINLKFLDISVEILMQRFVPDGNFSSQWYWPRQVVLFDLPRPTETCRSVLFPKTFWFQCHFCWEIIKFPRKENGTLQSRWKLCFNRTMPFHFSWPIPLVFLPVGSAKWKARPYNSESEALGDYKPITTLIPSNEYGCVRLFGAGISLIYAGIHEDH